MKNIKLHALFLTALLVVGCEQEITDLKPADIATPETPTGTAGTLNLTKFVTLGNSLAAGFRSNALYTEGQEESLGKILAKQLSYAGGSATFNQPDINSVNGFSGFIPSTTIPLGRLILYDADGATDPDGAGCKVSRSAGPAAAGTPEITSTCPSAVTTPAVPAPYNSATFPLPAFTGNKTALNNFGVPGITVGELLVASSPNPAFNLYYSRFASSFGTSTIINDVVVSNPTFFLIEIGNNDILGYATGGASNPTIFTTTADFTTRYNGVTATLLGNLPNAKGVVANIPDVTALPYFFTVAWNSIEFKTTDCTAEATISALNAATAFGGYNAALDAIVAGAIPGVTLSAADAAKRKVLYAYGKNGVLITDETLPDLTAALSAISPALAVYGRTRQATATDLITLPAGSVLGACQIPPGSTTPSASYVGGVSAPLSDQYVLILSEIVDIKTRTAEFNAVIAQAVANSNDRLALADVNTAFNNFVATKGAVMNGVLLTPSITPPYAGFSEDAVHPNGRGYAFLANIFIDAINAKFGASIPKAIVTDYSGNRTPISTSLSY